MLSDKGLDDPIVYMSNLTEIKRHSFGSFIPATLDATG
jgi:hypothetical protein